MATRMMQRNNLADAFVLVNDEQTNAALKAAREQIGDAEWKKGYSPENKAIVRDALKEHGARYEQLLKGNLVGVQVAETQANGETFRKLRVTLENEAGRTILSADMGSEFAQRLITKLDTATREHAGGEISIGAFAKQTERDDRTFVDHVATMKGPDGQEVPATPGHFEKARERVEAAQKPMLDAGMKDRKILNQIAASTRESYFAEVAAGLSERLVEQGITPKTVANERGEFPALEAGIKDRDGTWHNMSAYEKDGHLVGTLQRRGGQPGEYEKVPLEFHPGELGGLQAEAQFTDGAPLLVSLSRSEPSETQPSKVDVRIFAKGQDLEGKDTLEQIHEHPGRLRANDALQKIPDHREGKAIEQALGVDPKMLNPVPAREAQRAPAKAQEKQHSQGVQL
ncbi:hypothetical protein RU820_07410 [Acidithiobacillus ferrooxidans]|uniref:Uncharacterized protein n=1 Tax=Acidithiobacillus ferrooxidans (strain ATCC 23270 / DSM 14882 / CIP 104768 / NCIMB 8455) TaxID=243159 RepID=B7JAV6_ACIF2|nr:MULTISPECIES: hypothetical protein [Acidithiobacillus]ACK77843.1 hypothetical protein AFE_1616 [Acidithiobacillus ferrooxidans ATCC 23270]MBN6744674.1 hypothetical protein [Acidithiobacillus sp. MC2.2]MBN6747634.1 hypothetical protein [Acidithiobacillus sp. PG05]MCR0968558.1 hypothetical protein [Acidithiobacillus ferrooxidans]MCR1349408.1 hypothetical protein [Acidithiobacillus ferrooxidans]